MHEFLLKIYSKDIKKFVKVCNLIVQVLLKYTIHNLYCTNFIVRTLNVSILSRVPPYIFCVLSNY